MTDPRRWRGGWGLPPRPGMAGEIRTGRCPETFALLVRGRGQSAGHPARWTPRSSEREREDDSLG
jgi:hypothetical protein